jgi:hypothetical protein
VRVGGGGSVSGSMVPHGTRPELTEAFAICLGEMDLHAGERVVGIRELAPILDGIEENTRLLEVLDGKADGHSFGDRIVVSNKSATFTDLCPQIFKGLGAVPREGKAFEVLVEVIGVRVP